MEIRNTEPPHQEEQQQSKPQPLAPIPGMNRPSKGFPLTYQFMLINAFIYVLQVIYPLSGTGMELTGMDGDAGNLWRYGSLNFLLVFFKDEYFRLVTAVFVHSMFIHFLINMLNLFVIGIFIERLFGKSKFLIIYIITGIVASLSSYYFSFSITDSVGASGAIFGCVGALTSFVARRRKHLDPKASRTLLITLIFIIALNIAFGFGWNIFSDSNVRVDNAGHLGGLISGLVLGIFIPARMIQSSPTAEKIYRYLGYAMVVILVISFFWAGLAFNHSLQFGSYSDYLLSG